MGVGVEEVGVEEGVVEMEEGGVSGGRSCRYKRV